MRIIAGKHRGRRLASPAGNHIRPTTDRIRESLFSILGDLHDLVVVDGYAGTGAFGCEALSRGARKVWFFDASRAAVQLVRQNVATLGEQDQAVITQARFVEGLLAVDDDIDVVFLDPPYGSTEPAAALAALVATARLRDDSVVVLEQGRDDEVPELPELTRTDERLYGSTRLSFFARQAGADLEDPRK